MLIDSELFLLELNVSEPRVLNMNKEINHKGYVCTSRKRSCSTLILIINLNNPSVLIYCKSKAIDFQSLNFLKKARLTYTSK